MTKRYESWGRFPKVKHTEVVPVFWRTQVPDLAGFGKPVLPFGMGRSYGDVCLNEGGVLLDASYMSRCIDFDEENGLLRCEAGATLDEILKLVVPKGWFLPVTPGTKYVTLGGAIANDVHGKNHHKAGTFGRYVTRFELLRSDGERLICSPEENVDLFKATIGGLGLTGLILWAEIRLKPIKSAMIEVEKIKFGSLDEFFEISASSDEDYDYTVAWIDCLATGENLGRGIFMRGNHADAPVELKPHDDGRLIVPVDFPGFVLNPLTMKLFNLGYYGVQRKKIVKSLMHYDPFFYPLDSIREWNRIYGKKGFLQYQFVIPTTEHRRTIKAILERIARSGVASFLAVLKEFGDIRSPGMLSFPRPGVTLSLDMPFRGGKTLLLLEELDKMVMDAGGVLYPAKDARMSALDFQTFFPQWREFARFVDPHFSSNFWRRVTQPIKEGIE